MFKNLSWQIDRESIRSSPRYSPLVVELTGDNASDSCQRVRVYSSLTTVRYDISSGGNLFYPGMLARVPLAGRAIGDGFQAMHNEKDATDELDRRTR